MFSFLLNISMLLENQPLDRLKQPNVITGIVLLVVGIIFAIFAKKLTKLIRKKPNVEPNDKLLLIFKAFALVVILASLIIMVIQ